MDILKTSYRLRDVGIPTKFLRSNIKKWRYINEEGVTNTCWAMGSEIYVKEACKVEENQIETHNLQYPSSMRHGSNSPFSTHHIDLSLMLPLSVMNNSQMYIKLCLECSDVLQSWVALIYYMKYHYCLNTWSNQGKIIYHKPATFLDI